MANRNWRGGTTAVAQVDHLTPGGTIEADDRFIVTLTAEDGTTTESINVEAGGTTVADVCAAVQAAAASSTEAMFQAVDWTEDGSKIIATAKVAGVPFYCTVSTTEAGGGAADDQTFTRSSSTANAGPNDWNTAANWSGSTVPVSTDDIRILGDEDGISHEILYGLNQASIAAASLFIGHTFTGRVGTADFALKIDATTLTVESGGERTNLDGTFPTIRVKGLAGHINGRLDLDGDMGDLYILGPAVRGAIEVADNATLDNVYMVAASGARLTIGESVGGLTDVYVIGGGEAEVRSAATTLRLVGGHVQHYKGAVTNVQCYSGHLEYRGGGTITNLDLFGGVFDLSRSLVDALIITNTDMLGGVFREAGSGLALTFSNDPVIHGGVYSGAGGATLTTA